MRYEPGSAGGEREAAAAAAASPRYEFALTVFGAVPCPFFFFIALHLLLCSFLSARAQRCQRCKVPALSPGPPPTAAPLLLPLRGV